MKKSNNTEKIFLLLRLAVAMCFIGHGAFGIITKAVWCNYFAVLGIGHDMAYRIMPLLGTSDILMGVSLLVFPTRAVASWLVIWGLVTAALRPLSGEPFAEFVERAGNFGVPAALLILCGGFYQIRNHLFQELKPPNLPNREVQKRLISCLRITVFLLLIGHGWLNMIEKTGLINQYKSLGIRQAAMMTHYFGSFEIISAVIVLIFSYRPFILVIFVWKISSELFYPHYEIFEWIERGGSYAAILGLWLGLRWKQVYKPKNIFASGN